MRRTQYRRMSYRSESASEPGPRGSDSAATKPEAIAASNSAPPKARGSRRWGLWAFVNRLPTDIASDIVRNDCC
jgi:hypothetical protein